MESCENRDCFVALKLFCVVTKIVGRRIVILIHNFCTPLKFYFLWNTNKKLIWLRFGVFLRQFRWDLAFPGESCAEVPRAWIYLHYLTKRSVLVTICIKFQNQKILASKQMTHIPLFLANGDLPMSWFVARNVLLVWEINGIFYKCRRSE